MAPSAHHARSPRDLVLGIALFILLGSPLVAYLWDTLNRLLSGIVEPVRLLIFVPVAFLFYLLLRAMSRAVEAWHGEDDSEPLQPR